MTTRNLSLMGEWNPENIAQVYEQRFNRIERALEKILAAGATTLHKVDIDVYDAPSENEVVIDWPRDRFCFYHDGLWHCTPEDPEHAIKVYSDTRTNVAGDGIFRFDVEESLHNHEIIRVEAFNGTTGGGTTLVQISNRTRNLDILSTRLTIAGGQYHDNNAAVIRTDIVDGLAANIVKWKDRIWIDGDSVSGKGLGCFIRFRKARSDAL